MKKKIVPKTNFVIDLIFMPTSNSGYQISVRIYDFT